MERQNVKELHEEIARILAEETLDQLNFFHKQCKDKPPLGLEELKDRARLTAYFVSTLRHLGEGYAHYEEPFPDPDLIISADANR